MYVQAEVEDPGYDDGDEEREGGDEEFRTPTFRAFKNLERLELLVSRLAIDADEFDEEELGGEGQGDEEDTIKRFSMEEIEESSENFESTMKEKNPGVKVTYTILGED